MIYILLLIIVIVILIRYLLNKRLKPYVIDVDYEIVNKKSREELTDFTLIQQKDLPIK